MKIVTGDKDFFKGIQQVKFEGVESDNPFAFRLYDKNKIVAAKTMKETLRFARAYWHSFVGMAPPLEEEFINLRMRHSPILNR